MADTKQATAETACEQTCDLVHGRHSQACLDLTYRTPRTQPSQTELRIPDDLAEEYARAKAKGWQRRVELIERIARLEGAIRWANGEVDEFPERKPGEGAYWWRKELTRRARLEGSR